MANQAGLAGMWFKKKTKVPFVLNLQMGQSDEKIRKYLGLLFRYYKKIYLSADYIHAISNFLKKRAIRFGVNPKKIRVIPNGVDLKKFNCKRFDKKSLTKLKENLELKNKKILITSSRLSRKNGLEYVIRAMKLLSKKHPDLVFLIIGIGELEKNLKMLVKELELKDKIKFMGQVKNYELPKYLCMSDIFIRPSLSEGQGISFIEAMACGLPVIATPVGGIPDFIEDGKTGYFCRPKNPKGIVETIEKILKSSNKEIVSGAKQLVKKKYDWKNIMKKIEKLCEK